MCFQNFLKKHGESCNLQTRIIINLKGLESVKQIAAGQKLDNVIN